MTRANRLLIGPASPPQASEALSLVFRRLSGEDRIQRVEALLADALSGRVSLAGLLEARRQGRLVGAMFSQVQVGNTAVVWPPRLLPGEPMATARELIAAMDRWLAGQPVRVAHALLESVIDEDDALLRGGGYEPLAELLYLASQEGAFPRCPPSGPLQFEPYRSTNHDRLARSVEATYHQTLDCPTLNGIRDVEDVLAGYRAVGAFAADRWLIVRHRARDVGCLLLAEHPEQDNVELVYMGLQASARGNGWGTHMARHAQWLTRKAGRPRLVLAVDAANAPAIAVYRAVGFELLERRKAYLKVFGGSG